MCWKVSGGNAAERIIGKVGVIICYDATLYKTVTRVLLNIDALDSIGKHYLHFNSFSTILLFLL